MATRILFVDQSALIQKMAVQAYAQQKIEVIKVGSGDLATWPEPSRGRLDKPTARSYALN
jgi:hypothetical protein